jgi:hypothetical protein
MAIGNVQYWIQHPEALDKDSLYELRNLASRYPYFQAVRLLLLKNLYILRDPSFGEELRRTIIYIPNRLMLFQLIEGGTFALKALKPAAQSGQQPLEDVSIDRTLSLIDAFLATVPTEVQENDTIEMDYAVDYTAYLINEGEEPTAISEVASEPNLLKGQDLIDDFIEQSENADKEKSLLSLSDIKPAPQTEADELDETCFTETLAKIYVKQQRYDKALEIIRKLSLNYPKKNAYFADQIRFLEKLIINAKFKQ